MGWLHEFARALEASDAATLVGFVASLVSIAGVPFAIWGTWRARRAAEAAKAAAEATALRINMLDAVRRLASTLTSLDEFQERLASENRSELVRLGKAARRELIDLAEFATLFPADDQATMQATIGTLRNIEDWLAGDRGTEAGDIGAGLRKQLAGRLDEVHRLLSKLKQRGWG